MREHAFKVVALVLYKMTLERDNDLSELLLCGLPLLKYREVNKMRAGTRTHPMV